MLVLDVVFDSGNGTLMTFGFASVDIIKKKSNKKNIMSLKALVATSVWNRLFRLMAMLQSLFGGFHEF